MSKVIKRFLVGLGFDTTEFDQGQQKVTSGLSAMRGGVAIVSAAMVGAFGAMAASVISTANRVDGLALKTSNLNTSTQFVYNYGNALRTLGGDASEALSAVQSIEETLNNLRVRGEMGALNDLALAGIDISRLQTAPDAQEFLRILAEQIPSMDLGQRAVARDALGLSDAALRSLTMGVDAFNEAIARAESITGNIEGLVDNSRKLNESASELALTVEGINNELAERFLPSLVGVTSRLNDFLVNNRGAVTDTLDKALDAGVSTVLLGPALGPAVSAGQQFVNQFTGGESAFVRPQQQATREQAFGPMLMSDPANYINRIDQLGRDSYDASSAVSPVNRAAMEEDRAASAEALAGALSRAPVRVENRLDMTIQLDGQALESKITEVNERQAFDTLEDLRTTTDR